MKFKAACIRYYDCMYFCLKSVTQNAYWSQSFNQSKARYTEYYYSRSVIFFWLPDMQIPTVLRQFVLLHLQSHWLCRVFRNSVVDGKVFKKEIHLTRNLLLNVLHNFESINSVPRIIQRDTVISIRRVSYKVPVQIWLTTLIPKSSPHPPYVKSSSSQHQVLILTT